MNSNVFIITAAHQYLYIYEAVKKFHADENNILYFMNFQDNNEYLQLKNILLDINWKAIVEIPLYKYQSLIYRLFQYKLLVKKLNNHQINALYLSQYGTSYSYLILNSVDAKKKIITDDGQALILFSKIRRENLNSKQSNSSKLKQILYKLYEPEQLTFFTTTNMSVINLDKVIKNYLDNVRSFFSKKEISNSVLFLGSPFVAKDMMSQKKYMKLLKNIFGKYKSDKIIYYPHRAENIDDLKIINNHFTNVDVVTSSGPVEFYLVTEIHPKKIISFYSGAIPNLITLFKDAIKIDAIKIPEDFFASPRILDSANSVYKEYVYLESDNFKLVDLTQKGVPEC